MYLGGPDMNKKSNRELEIENIAFNTSIEINGISMLLLGLMNQFDNEFCDSLTPDSLVSAIYAIRMQLERVAADLENIAATEKGATNT